MNPASYIRACSATLALSSVFPIAAEIRLDTGAQAADMPARPAQISSTLASAAALQNRVLAPQIVLGESAANRNANELDNGPDLLLLRARGLAIPLQNVTESQLTNNYWQPRFGGIAHEALDIMAPKGTPVIAVGDGRVAKLFLSKPGGLTVYQFDPQGEYSYYYAHLDSYAEGLKEGDVVRRGQVIAYVGSTGNASAGAPHLHFAVFRLGPARQWWRGTPINPFLIWRNSSH